MKNKLLREAQTIKNIMFYDTSKTYTENKKIISEIDLTPVTLQEVSKNIRYWLTGDVQSVDLGKIHNELKNKVFGQLFEGGVCGMEKLIQYYQKERKGASWQDFFGTTAALTLGMSEWKRGTDLISDIQATDENEGGFEDIKNKLLTDIDNELKGFCKTKTKTSTTTSNDSSNTQLAQKGKYD